MVPNGALRRGPRENGDSHDDVRTGSSGRTSAREVQASVLAAFQLVEDAHYFGNHRRPGRDPAPAPCRARRRGRRKLARDLAS